MVTLEASTERSQRSEYLSSCTGCLFKEVSICSGFSTNAKRGAEGTPFQVKSFPQHQTIVHHRDLPNFVPVICDGWATSIIRRSDGRRKTFSVLLPGDLASINYLFEPCEGRLIESASDVTCRSFDRNFVLDKLKGAAHFAEPVGRAFRQERERVETALIDLSVLSGESRIASFLLQLFNRLKEKGLVTGMIFPFPMRQKQFADAICLSPVHVSRILTNFRNDGLIAKDGKNVEILDYRALENIAETD